MGRQRCREQQVSMTAERPICFSPDMKSSWIRRRSQRSRISQPSAGAHHVTHRPSATTLASRRRRQASHTGAQTRQRTGGRAPPDERSGFGFCTDPQRKPENANSNILNSWGRAVPHFFPLAQRTPAPDISGTYLRLSITSSRQRHHDGQAVGSAHRDRTSRHQRDDASHQRWCLLLGPQQSCAWSPRNLAF